MALRSIIIEGIDRIGKNLLIDSIKQRLGFFQEIHYQKPELLDTYTSLCGNEQRALKRYQERSFTDMFRLLSSDARLILNRAHLGEFVYAPRYRHYSGDYVFDLERAFIDQGSNFHKTTLLVLLYTSSFEFIKDDGLSFDFSKKEEEQEDFKRAFLRSQIRNKIMIDVNVGGSYRPAEQILGEVIKFYSES